MPRTDKTASFSGNRTMWTNTHIYRSASTQWKVLYYIQTIFKPQKDLFSLHQMDNDSTNPTPRLLIKSETGF